MRLLPVVVLLAILAATAWRFAPPDARPATAPPDEFSAARALDVLHDLLREQVPHPVGSPANAVVRDRIIARFRQLGYSTSIHQGYACNRRGRCEHVENIVATLPGQRPAVLGTAHYDSVPQGPGTSDDGAGVAAMLEAARAMRADRPRNPTGFLITDGEEAGLLGAEAFVADLEHSRDVIAVVNVENRGTSGPSFLFETSRNNAPLIRLAARALHRPFASSLFYTVYELMPNDTDVSVFKRAGKEAVNFAAIGNVRLYHRAQDDLRHVDIRTLQQHGENALAMLRALGSADLTATGRDAVFFDILGLGIVYWPAGATIVIVLVSLGILLPAMRGRRPAGIAWGAAAFVVAITAAAALGIVMMKLLPHRPPPWLIAAAWCLGLAVALLVARLALRRATPRELFLGCALMWHLAAGSLALTLPGTSYLVAVPALLAAVAAHSRSETAIAVAFAAPAGLLMFPLALMVCTAMGAFGLVADAALLALVGMTFAWQA